MFKKITLINILLLLLVIFLGTKIFHIWFSPKDQTDEISVKSTKKSFSRPGMKKKVVDKSAYRVITEKSLFSPTRKGEEAETEDNQVISPTATKNFTLYGISIIGDQKNALISSLPSPRKKTNTVLVKEGEYLDQCLVVGIKEDRVIFRAGEDTFEVLLYDPSHPKNRRAARTTNKAPRVKRPKKNKIPSRNKRSKENKWKEAIRMIEKEFQGGKK